jgi:hypothetical protein
MGERACSQPQEVWELQALRQTVGTVGFILPPKFMSAQNLRM